MTDADRDAELRSLIQFAKELDLREESVRAIYEAIASNDKIAPHARLDEAQRQLRMLVK